MCRAGSFPPFPKAGSLTSVRQSWEGEKFKATNKGQFIYCYSELDILIKIICTLSCHKTVSQLRISQWGWIDVSVVENTGCSYKTKA